MLVTFSYPEWSFSIILTHDPEKEVFDSQQFDGIQLCPFSHALHINP